MTGILRCPTCRAAWRAAATCPRCGTDLSGLMRVAQRAWWLRDLARRALWAGDRPDAALAAAQAACRLHETPYGQRLLVLALLVNGRRSEAWAVVEQMTPRDPDGPGVPLPDPSEGASHRGAGGPPTDAGMVDPADA